LSSRNPLPPLADLERALQSCGERPAAVLAVRLPQFAELAWQRSKAVARALERRTAAAFARSASRGLRGDDRLAHDPGSDIFAVAILGAPRESRALAPLDARAALERIVEAIAAATGLRAVAGWSLVRTPIVRLGRELEVALERGARERERYEFFAAVGHELRTPLTSIRGYLETLQDGGLDEATRGRFLETARREALRLGRLVDGMLDFSMLDLSGETFAPASCDVGEQIGAACEALAPQARQRRIAFERRRAAAVRVGLGADSLTQALVNILDNAVKYGREGGRIRVGWRVCAPYACIRVDDDGPGIGGARRPGRGIGLTIVRTIVERAGGEVRASRSPLGGARFELRLPMRKDAQAP
jgi:signal transduction histidine kinase